MVKCFCLSIFLFSQMNGWHSFKVWFARSSQLPKLSHLSLLSRLQRPSLLSGLSRLSLIFTDFHCFYGLYGFHSFHGFQSFHRFHSFTVFTVLIHFKIRSMKTTSTASLSSQHWLHRCCDMSSIDQHLHRVAPVTLYVVEQWWRELIRMCHWKLVRISANQSAALCFSNSHTVFPITPILSHYYGGSIPQTSELLYPPPQFRLTTIDIPFISNSLHTLVSNLVQK